MEAPPPAEIMPAKSEDKLEIEKEEQEQKAKSKEDLTKDKEEDKEKDEKEGEEKEEKGEKEKEEKKETEEKKGGGGGGKRKKKKKNIKTPKVPGFLRSASKERTKNKVRKESRPTLVNCSGRSSHFLRVAWGRKTGVVGRGKVGFDATESGGGGFSFLCKHTQIHTQSSKVCVGLGRRDARLT